MTKHDLNKLKDLAPPAPREGAKAAALAAAMDAFEDVSGTTERGKDKIVNLRPGTNSIKDENSTKGTTAPSRHTHATSNPPRRTFMRMTKTSYAIAASLVVTAVSVPVLMQYYEDSHE